MSRTLSIPIHQTITLPDDWQACRTPQELSYWLISQFDEFEHNVETLAADVAALQSDVDNLEDTVSNIDARLVVVEGQINNPTDGILATLAALAAADTAINAHLDDTDHNVSSNAAGIYQLNVDVTAINADLVNIHDALITQGSNILTLQTDTTALKTTVGDSTSGLVKKTNDLEAKIDGPNGLDDRVTALEQSGGGKVYQHTVTFNPTPNSKICQIRFYSTQSTRYTFAQIRDKVLVDTQYYFCRCSGDSAGTHDGMMSGAMLYKSGNNVAGVLMTIQKDVNANTCKMYRDSLTLTSIGIYKINEM